MLLTVTEVNGLVIASQTETEAEEKLYPLTACSPTGKSLADSGVFLDACASLPLNIYFSLRADLKAFSAVFSEGMFRRPGFEKDLEFFLGPSWRQKIPPGPAVSRCDGAVEPGAFFVKSSKKQTCQMKLGGWPPWWDT